MMDGRNEEEFVYLCVRREREGGSMLVSFNVLHCLTTERKFYKGFCLEFYRSLDGGGGLLEY